MSSQSLHVVSWNVNGLRSALRKGFASVAQQLKPDVLCLQETKALPTDVPDFATQVPGYAATWRPAEKKGYSGVLTLTDTKVPLRHSKLDLLGSSTPAQNLKAEGRMLITEHHGITVANFYFPSGTSGEDRQGIKYQFLDLVFQSLSDLPKAKRNNLIVCGDFNICHHEIDIHHPEEATRRQLTGFLPDERGWMDTFVALGFVDSFRLLHPTEHGRYSWWTYRANAREKNLGWRIDYCFVSSDLAARVVAAEIHEGISGSDHCPVSIRVEI